MSTSTDDRTKPARFSGFTRPGTAGIGPMSLPLSLAFGADLIFSIYALGYVNGKGQLLIWTQLALFLVLGIFRNADGMSLLERIARRGQHAAFDTAGVTQHQAPLLGAKKPTSVFTKVDALEYTTEGGTTFCLMHYPDANLYALPLRTRPNGGERIGTEARNQRTADWAAFGNDMASLDGPSQVVVVSEAAPRTQVEARRTMERYASSPTGSTNAQKVTLERLQMGLEDHADIETWVAVTFRATTKGTSDAARAANAGHISGLLPTIQHRLSAAGAGRVTTVTERDCAEYYRAAIDPAARALIEAAHAEGEDTGMEWAEAGPMVSRPRHETYLTDGCVSQTFYMTQPPSGEVDDTILRDLIAPHPEIEIKRVALVIQIIDRGRGAVLADRNIKTADNRVAQLTGSGMAKRTADMARKTNDEFFEGYALQDFTIMATVSVTDPTRLKTASEVMRSRLGPGIGARFRIAYGQQDVGFHYTLPFGLDLHGHSVAEAAMRQATTAH